MSSSVDRLFMEHRSTLRYFLINRLRNATEAEDLLQDIYLKLRKMKEGTELRNPRAFLFTLAANLATTHFHRKQRMQELAQFEEEFGTGQDKVIDFFIVQPSQESHAFSRQWYRGFMDAIALLPTKRRRIFIMHRVEHKSYRDIALELGISIKMVEKQMTKALSHCRKQMNAFLDTDEPSL